MMCFGPVPWALAAASSIATIFAALGSFRKSFHPTIRRVH
jgi:hypothetical protein